MAWKQKVSALKEVLVAAGPYNVKEIMNYLREILAWFPLEKGGSTGSN